MGGNGRKGFAMTATIARTGRVTPASQSVADQPLPDEALVGRVARGDKLAMRSLFARHRVRIYRFVLRITRDESLTEDLVSDVFLEVWRRAAAYEARATVSTWLLAIARYKATSALRRHTEVVLDAETASAIVDPADDPETALQDKDRGEVLRRCLAQLSPEHAAIIDLVYYHERSVKEVADIVGIPEPTVKTRIFYARKKLADMMKARHNSEQELSAKLEE